MQIPKLFAMNHVCFTNLYIEAVCTAYFRYIGENDFGCTCDWLELVRMFNKYKVAIADAEDTPACDDTDIKCGQ